MADYDPTHDARYLEVFPSFLRTLGEDAATLGVLAGSDAPEVARRYVVAGLNYIFKSLDLIPDGIDDLGFLDDAFVLRVAACARRRGGAPGRQAAASSQRLGEDAQAVQDFLGEDYARLEALRARAPQGGGARTHGGGHRGRRGRRASQFLQRGRGVGAELPGADASRATSEDAR